MLSCVCEESFVSSYRQVTFVLCSVFPCPLIYFVVSHTKRLFLQAFLLPLLPSMLLSDFLFHTSPPRQVNPLFPVPLHASRPLSLASFMLQLLGFSFDIHNIFLPVPPVLQVPVLVESPKQSASTSYPCRGTPPQCRLGLYTWFSCDPAYVFVFLETSCFGM